MVLSSMRGILSAVVIVGVDYRYVLCAKSRILQPTPVLAFAVVPGRLTDHALMD